MPPESASDQNLRSACDAIRLRVKNGEADSAATLLQSRPELSADPEYAVEIIYTEFVELDAAGRRPKLDDWLAQFPVHRERLERLVRLHDAISAEDEGLTLTERGDAAGDHVSKFDCFGKYEILEERARGGMGVVYRARDVELNRLVALKVVLSGIGSAPADIERFRAEAEIVAQLQHPNIVQIHEIGMVEDRPYLALEYIAGGTLDDLLQGKPQPPQVAARMTLALAEAMQHAHQRNVVHRDLKPSNILIATNGAPKITDFGLAKRLDLDHGRTRSGTVLGTPCYMSPEQATGTREVGPSADVYALGVILYEMLTGRVPFTGISTSDTLEQVRSQEPVAPRQMMPSVPRDLETICLKCLEKVPSQRYGSAQRLADDLRRYLHGDPVQARPMTFAQQIVKEVLRVNHDFPKYRQWSHYCFALAPLPPMALLLVTMFLRSHPWYAYIAIVTTLVLFGIAQVLLMQLTREGFQYFPGKMRRHIENVLVANQLAEFLAVFAVWMHTPGDEPQRMLLVFPIWSAMIAILFWALATEIGFFYVVGTIAMVLSVLSAIWLDWSPAITSLIFLTNIGGQALLYRWLANELDAAR